MSVNTYGAHAEYLCIHEDGPVAIMPKDAGFDEAVVCEGAWYANNCLRKLELAPGQKILIYGGSGAIVSAAVQLAKSYGAEVTAVVHARHTELVKSLGADHVIDYTAEDFTKTDETFDCVLDAVGKTTFFRCRKLLKASGVLAATDLGPKCFPCNLVAPCWKRESCFPSSGWCQQICRLHKNADGSRGNTCGH